MKKSTLTLILSLVGAISALAGAIIVLYKIVKKRLKFSVEVLPDDIEDPNELTAAVDAINIDIPDEEAEMEKEMKEEMEEEFEIAFVEEDDAVNTDAE